MIGSDGQRIGKVDDLIVDRELMKVRYLDVDVDKNRVLPDTDARHILVPIGAAQLDDDSDQVFVSMDQAALARVPFYRGGAVDAEYEYRVMHAVTSPSEPQTAQTMQSTSVNTGTGAGMTAPNADFYNREHFDEDRFYHKRQQHRQDQSHMQATASSAGFDNGNPVHEDIATIERLRQMLEQGTITHDEFVALKRKAIGL